MKNYHFLYIVSITFLILNEGCNCSKNTFEPPRYSNRKVKFNLIGITGKDSTQPYIELFYSKDSNGQNNTAHEWVKPPYLFGEHYVNVKKVSFCISPPNCGFQTNILLCNYNEGGDSYLKIVNHSNISIEMFILDPLETRLNTEVECNSLSTDPDNKPPCLKTIRDNPSPIYKYAPLYYLLKTDKIPADMSNVFYGTGLRNFYPVSFNKSKIGDINLDKKYTINDIMNIFRAEYNKSKDTILYKSYIFIDQSLNENRLYILNEKYKKNPLYSIVNTPNFIDDFTLTQDKNNWDLRNHPDERLKVVKGNTEFYKLIPANGTFYSLRENPIVSFAENLNKN